MGNNRVLLIITTILIGILVMYAFWLTFSYLRNKKNNENKVMNIIEGTTDIQKVLELNNQGKSKKEIKNQKKKHIKKKKGIKKLYEEYLYFGGSIKKLIIELCCGYLIFFLVYFLLSKNLLISTILSFLYLVIFYVFLESNLKKKRIRFIKSFVSSLEVISASLIAGNSLPEGLTAVTKRERLNPIVRREFTLLTNNLKSNISLQDALESFQKRNNLFEEISMFVIVIQFFEKSGGKNMQKVFESLKDSLSQKVENYSLIESKLNTYQMCFNIFMVVEILATFICPLFIKGFYENINSAPINIVKVLGSVALSLIAVFLFKNSIKKTAEA